MLSTLMKVAVMNLLLSSDNALMIAVISNKSAKKHRFSATAWSFAASAVLQLILLALISYLFHFTFLQVFFGLFICFMAFQLLHKDKAVENAVEHEKLLPLIGKITVGNLMMSFENAAALVGIAQGQVWLAWVGVVITSALVFFGSHLLSSFLDKYDFVIYLGSVLLFWIGAKLVFAEPMIAPYATMGPLITSAIYFVYVAFTYAAAKRKVKAQ